MQVRGRSREPETVSDSPPKQSVRTDDCPEGSVPEGRLLVGPGTHPVALANGGQDCPYSLHPKPGGDDVRVQEERTKKGLKSPVIIGLEKIRGKASGPLKKGVSGGGRTNRLSQKAEGPLLCPI